MKWMNVQYYKTPPSHCLSHSKRVDIGTYISRSKDLIPVTKTHTNSSTQTFNKERTPTNKLIGGSKILCLPQEGYFEEKQWHSWEILCTWMLLGELDTWTIYMMDLISPSKLYNGCREHFLEREEEEEEYQKLDECLRGHYSSIKIKGSSTTTPFACDSLTHITNADLGSCVPNQNSLAAV